MDEEKKPRRVRKKPETTPVSQQEAEIDLQQMGEKTARKPRKLVLSLTKSKSGDYATISTNIARKILKAAGVEFGKTEVEIEGIEQQSPDGLRVILRVKLEKTSD